MGRTGFITDTVTSHSDHNLRGQELLPAILSKNWKLHQLEVLAPNPSANKLWKHNLNPDSSFLCFFYNSLASPVKSIYLSWAGKWFLLLSSFIYSVHSPRPPHVLPSPC